MKLTIGKSILLGILSAFSLNTYAGWQCYVADQGGHAWTSTGETQERANTVATSFCSAYSPDGETCHTSRCFEK